VHQGNKGVIALINRLALLLALTITLLIPLAYLGLKYSDDAYRADKQAQVKAGAITSLISGNPKLWSFQVQRLEELLVHYPVPIGEYRVNVYDAQGARVVGVGERQDWPLLERSQSLYDSGRAVGRVEITHSLRPLIFDTVLAALLGLLLGSAVYGVLWIGPLHALRQAELSLEAKYKELQASEVRYHTVANFTYDWEYWLSTDGSLPYVSPSCLRVTGFAASEFQEDPGLLSRIVHPDDREDFVRHLRGIESTQTNVDHCELDFRIITPDGEVRWIAHICQAISDGSGRYLGRRACNRDITERKEVEQALQQSLKDKEALLKEVHHRVKNNMQVITSLLRLESRRRTEPETKAVLNEMQARIRSMALLHESLYRSGTFASVDLGTYLNRLATEALRFMASGDRVLRLQLALGSLQVGMDQAIACGLLVNELISNCFKHGFPEGSRGEVHIELQPTDESAMWRLRVSDTGVGLPADFEERRKTSLGLQLVSDLSKQLGGTLTIDSPAGQGAAFTVIFKPQEPAALLMP
jgi:PAS domain S-box-containing protein